MAGTGFEAPVGSWGSFQSSNFKINLRRVLRLVQIVHAHRNEVGLGDRLTQTMYFILCHGYVLDNGNKTHPANIYIKHISITEPTLTETTAF